MPLHMTGLGAGTDCKPYFLRKSTAKARWTDACTFSPVAYCGACVPNAGATTSGAIEATAAVGAVTTGCGALVGDRAEAAWRLAIAWRLPGRGCLPKRRLVTCTPHPKTRRSVGTRPPDILKIKDVRGACAYRSACLATTTIDLAGAASLRLDGPTLPLGLSARRLGPRLFCPLAAPAFRPPVRLRAHQDKWDFLFSIK